MKPIIIFAIVAIVAFVTIIFLKPDHGNQPANKGDSSVSRIEPNSANPSVVKTTLTPIEQLEKTEPSALTPNGILAEMFDFGGDFTDLQRQLKLKEIRGKVVEWQLPVYEVKQSGDNYIIQTSTSFRGKRSGEKVIGTFLHVTALNDDDRRLIESLKTGDLFKFKGVIDDVTLRHLNINPTILNETFSRRLLSKVYGKYMPENDCWQALNSESKQQYCMKVGRTDKIKSNTGDRYYVLAFGDAVDEEGTFNGNHTSTGMVGAFVVEIRSGQSEIVASDSQMFMGEFGYAPTNWNFVKLGSPDYWGWQNQTGFCNQGYCSHWYVILAPYEKQIRDLANSMLASWSEGKEDGDSLDTKLHIDSSRSNEKVFPLELTMTGYYKGAKLIPKTLKVPFDEQKWTYVGPAAKGW